MREDSHETSKNNLNLNNYFYNEDKYKVCGSLGGLLWSTLGLTEEATEMTVFDLRPQVDKLSLVGRW